MRKAMTLRERIEQQTQKLNDQETSLKKEREKLNALRDTEALRIGRLAVSAGLADYEVPEPQLVKAFEELAGRFRKPAMAAE